MPVSVTELYTIGIGPSSSHTVGPMRAAARFLGELREVIADIRRVEVELFGSLAFTGRGHRTDVAILLGLSGYAPETIDVACINEIVNKIRAKGVLTLGGGRAIGWNESTDLRFRAGHVLPGHSNGMRFSAFTSQGAVIAREYYSVGGGTIRAADEADAARRSIELRFHFDSAQNLLAMARDHKLTIAQIVLANEGAWRPERETLDYLDRVRSAMLDSIRRGCMAEGILLGGLNLPRRASSLFKRLAKDRKDDPLAIFDWVSLFALAVNEENAAGGRVVTAPTNGAAGVIPAVLNYYEQFCPNSGLSSARTFLLTAAGIGMLYRRNASISAAEMGCQGEIGVACSMAAAGLASVLGGTLSQIENAAEIGIEHNLGLTVRSPAGPRASPLHRAQHNGRGESNQCGASRVGG